MGENDLGRGGNKKPIQSVSTCSCLDSGFLILLHGKGIEHSDVILHPEALGTTRLTAVGLFIEGHGIWSLGGSYEGEFGVSGLLLLGGTPNVRAVKRMAHAKALSLPGGCPSGYFQPLLLLGSVTLREVDLHVLLTPSSLQKEAICQ